MRFKHLPLIGLFFAILSLAVIPGVFATWNYSAFGPQEKETSISLNVADFKWDGSENLPDSVEGEDHAWLILNIVGGVSSNGQEIGLNNPNSVINDRINDRLDGGWGWSRDYFGSMAVTGGDEVSELFDAKTSGLSFIVHVESDTVYYIYTTSVYLGERGTAGLFGNTKAGNPSIPIGEYIYPIYKTKLVRPNTSSDFEIVETKRGKAKSDWYDENRTNANMTQIPSFDINTWVETEMGQSATTANAIWTFVGDNPTAYATKEMRHVYYRITPKSAGTYTVWTDNLTAQIDIISNNGSTVVSSSSIVTQADGTQRVAVSWSASANTMYYIEITGDAVMQFHIS